MWAQTSFMAWERATSDAPPANLLNSSDTGIGFVIPDGALGFVDAALVFFLAAAAPAALAPAAVPAAGDIRNMDPRRTLATAAISVGVLLARALVSRTGWRGGFWGRFRVTDSTSLPPDPFCIWALMSGESGEWRPRKRNGKN
jgi:hypothetical protein